MRHGILLLRIQRPQMLAGGLPQFSTNGANPRGWSFNSGKLHGMRMGATLPRRAACSSFLRNRRVPPKIRLLQELKTDLRARCATPSPLRHIGLSVRLREWSRFMLQVQAAGWLPSLAGGRSQRGGVADIRAIGPSRRSGPHAVCISIIQGAISAGSSGCGTASAVTRGCDMIHIAVRVRDTRTCQLPPSVACRASASIAPAAPR